MSKAEERANERYNITRGDDTEETSGIDMQRASDFIDGYHQAEKDNELTWEDMRELHIIFSSLDVDIELSRSKLQKETLEYYEEVLKRFKERKEK